MSIPGRHTKETSGFTLVELIIGMTITMLLTLVIVGIVATLLGQYAVGNVRQKQTAGVQTALIRISDDIRQSHTVLAQNIESDANAPTPNGWRTGTEMLVLGKTPRDSSGNGLYDAPEYFSGNPDSIIYYLKGGTLYRRVVPAAYPGNTNSPIISCPTDPAGGCPGDSAILNDITQLQFTYFDVNNAVGAIPADTKSINVSITTGRQQSGHLLATTDSLRASIQTLATLTPPPPVNPPPGTQSTPGLMIGPGGLWSWFSNVKAEGMYSKGRLILEDQSKLNISSYRLDAANTGCGTRATFPVVCTGQQPIEATSFATSVTASPICAPGQTVMTHLTGYQAGCTLPNMNLPTFNKGNFTSSMTTTVNSNVTCDDSTYTIAHNTRINGNVLGDFCHGLTLAGNAYITGNFTIRNNSELKVANGVTTPPIIVVNGRVTIDFTQFRANSSGITPVIISFYSANTSGSNCSSSDTCVTIPNTELYDTINSSNHAISLTRYPNVRGSLYAYFGTASINFGRMTGALAGQRVIIDNNSDVNFTAGNWPQ